MTQQFTTKLIAAKNGIAKLFNRPVLKRAQEAYARAFDLHGQLLLLCRGMHL